MAGHLQPHYTLGQLAQLWINNGGSSALAPIMAAIAMAESGGDPSAHNASGASGLWQIMPVNAQYVPGGYGQVNDPNANAAAAVAVYKSQGLSAWQTYTNGAYKQFLSSAESTLSANQNLGSDPISNAVGGVESGVSSVTGAISGTASALDSIGNAVSWLFTPSNWLRMLKFIAGAVAIYIGLKALTGIDTSGPTKIAVKAAEVAK